MEKPRIPWDLAYNIQNNESASESTTKLILFRANPSINLVLCSTKNEISTLPVFMGEKQPFSSIEVTVGKENKNDVLAQF